MVSFFFLKQENNRRNYVEFLLENGVNPNVSDSNGIYPLDLAISAGNKEVELILKGYNAKQSGHASGCDSNYGENYP